MRTVRGLQEAEAFVEKTLGNLDTCTDAGTAAAETDLVIEAIVENLSVKQKLFKALDAVAPE